MPRKLLLYRLRTLGAISLIWALFGVVFHFNLLQPQNDLGLYLPLYQFTIAFAAAGFVVGAVLIFYLKPAFNHFPVWLSTLIKFALAGVLFVAIAFFLLLLYFVLLYHREFAEFTQSFFERIVYTGTFRIFMLDTGLMTLVSIMLLEVTDRYGPGHFWSTIVGEYVKPKIQNRIFIFLDINDSTALAERLGHEQYFRMLRYFFRGITPPLLANDGEVYQYVGDEIVLTWRNTPENKIKALKFLRNTFFYTERNRDKYLKKYGHVPQFKAGVHAGEVTAGLVGVVKRELIYCGDTLNTTARVRSLCHECGASFLLSEDFMYDFYQPHGYTIEHCSDVVLRGRSEPTKLYSVTF